MKTQEITAYAALAAISAVFQLVHLGYLTPWGMWIDIVAIPWILALFLYGGRGALTVSVVGAVIITLVAPSTWLGASMKWLATLPMFAVPWAMQRGLRQGAHAFRKLRLIALATLVAILLRGAIMLPTNYYYALPIWVGWTPEVAMAALPWWIIFSLNALQGIVEMAVAWLLVFKFRLERFASWR